MQRAFRVGGRDTGAGWRVVVPGKEMLRGEDDHEEEEGQKEPEEELEIVVPEVVDVGDYLLSEVCPFLLALLLEILHYIVISQGSVQLNSRAHSGAD